MPALAITGTIGSGKSMLLRTLGELLGAETFSADSVNRELLDEDSEVKGLISSQLGCTCYQANGHADRKALFHLISHDPTARSTLESILHPRIEALWKPKAEKFRKTPDAYFLAEIPLLYEKQLELFFDQVIVVGCSDSIRQERLHRLRSLSAAESAAWLTMQVPQSTKAQKAHHFLWNDGSENQLLRQIHLLASHFLHQ